MPSIERGSGNGPFGCSRLVSNGFSKAFGGFMKPLKVPTQEQMGRDLPEADVAAYTSAINACGALIQWDRGIENSMKNNDKAMKMQ